MQIVLPLFPMALRIPRILALPLFLAWGSTSALQAASLEVDKTLSSIEVDCKATGHSFTSVLKDYSISGSGNPLTLRPDALKIAWKFKDLDSSDKKRDAEMMKWLGGKDPEGSFKFTKTWAEEDGVLKAMGTLTINGVSQTVAFPVTIAKKDGNVVSEGKVVFKYTDFKLPVIRAMMVMTVDPTLVVRFHLVGKAK